METTDAERRSAIMARIRSKNTEPELRVRRAAHACGLRFRLHRRDLPGTPDVVFAKWRVALFVHGCFWHRHEGCRRASTPKSRQAFWQLKFDRNVARDRDKAEALGLLGWRVETVWECETRDDDRLRRRLASLFPAEAAPAEARTR